MIYGDAAKRKNKDLVRSLSTIELSPEWWAGYIKAQDAFNARIRESQRKRREEVVSYWDDFFMRNMGQPATEQTKKYAWDNLYSVVTTQSLLDGILRERKMEKRHSARIRQSLRATAPAATAEQTWAGYPLKVRRLTRQEREARKRFVERFYPNSSAFDVWYWLDGFHQVHTKATSWQKLTYGPRCLPVKENKYGRTVW
jgi:hypothetical protein